MFSPVTKISNWYPWPRNLLFEGEKEGLYKHAEGKEIIVEIGAFEGASAKVLKKAMCPKGCLYLIDPFCS